MDFDWSYLLHLVTYGVIVGILMRIKGGGIGLLRRGIGKLIGITYDDNNDPVFSNTFQKIYWELTDGKVLSTIGYGWFAVWIVEANRSEFNTPWYDWWVVDGFSLSMFLIAGLLWLAAVAPSVGEIIGSIGGIKGNWSKEGHSQGWGFQQGAVRGGYAGAMLTLAMGKTALIIGGVLFPVCYFIGVSIQQLVSGNVAADWKYGEMCWGIALGISLAMVV